MRLYLDTSILIRCVEGNGEEKAAALRWIDRAESAQGGTIVSSLFARAECLVKPIREESVELRQSFDMFFAQSGIVFLSVSDSILERATLIRAKYFLKMPDSIHIATALEASCSAAVMRDDPMRKKGPIFGIPLPHIND
jgi:predicted nucleic acid-binding protein